MVERTLAGLSVLIVEDEYLQARETSELLQRAGARVIGPTGHAEDVAGLIARELPDAAVVDINLGRGPSFDVADLLQRESVPFLFLTGYDLGPVRASFAAVPSASKPVNDRQLVSMVGGLCSR